MKKIFVFLAVFVLSTIYLLSQEYEYISLQPSGNTVVFTLNWVSDDTLEITVTERTSISGDEVNFYNLTSITGTINGDEYIVDGDEDTKFIAFDAPQAIAANDRQHGKCECSASGKCKAVIDNVYGGVKVKCISDPENPCGGNCKKIIYISPDTGSDMEFYNGGILVEAEHIIISNE